MKSGSLRRSPPPPPSSYSQQKQTVISSSSIFAGAPNNGNMNDMILAEDEPLSSRFQRTVVLQTAGDHSSALTEYHTFVKAAEPAVEVLKPEPRLIYLFCLDRFTLETKTLLLVDRVE